MKIDLALGSYEGRSKPLNASRCVNFYPVIDEPTSYVDLYNVAPQANKNSPAFYTSFGYTLFSDLGATSPEVRAIYRALAPPAIDRVFCVIATTLYEINMSTGDLTSRGTLTFGYGKVLIKNNLTELLIVEQNTDKAYTYNFNTDILTAQTFAAGRSIYDIEYYQGYFFAVIDGEWQWSAILDGSTWDPLDVIIPTPTNQGELKGIRILKDDILLLCDNAILVYYNDGTTPFSIKPGISIQYGVGNHINSAVITDESLIFQASSKLGQDYIIRLKDNYSVSALTKENISYQLSKYDYTDCFALAYEVEGHTFYHITYPAEEKTWVYDLTTQQWHERQSLNRFGEKARHTANCYANYNNIKLIGDYESGKIYQIDSTIYTEDDRQISGFIDCAPMKGTEERYITVFSLQVKMSQGRAPSTGQGSDPVLILTVSKDNKGFGLERYGRIGKTGEGQTRTKYNGLGTCRDFIYRLRYAEPQPQEIVQVVAKGSLGRS